MRLSGWKTEILDDLAEVITGSTPSTKDQSYYGHDVPFVSPADLGAVKYIATTQKWLSKKGFEKARKLPRNSVLFTCIGSTIGKIGIAARELATNQQINALVVNGKVDSEYLYYSLSRLAPQIKRLAGTQAVPLINKTDFSQTQIDYPPMAEQKKIAEILSTWDKAIELASKELDGLKKRLRAEILKLCWLNQETKGQVIRLGDHLQATGTLIKWDDSKQYPLASIRRRSGGIFHRETLLGSQILTKKLKLLSTKCFVISRMQVVHGAWGTTKERDLGMYVSDSYDLLVPKKGSLIELDYLDYLSRTRQMYRLALICSHGVHIEKMTFDLDDFLNQKVRVPSVDDQKLTAAYLQARDVEIERLTMLISLCQIQKQGLMQKLLTGKIRVKV